MSAFDTVHQAFKESPDFGGLRMCRGTLQTRPFGKEWQGGTFTRIGSISHNLPPSIPALGELIPGDRVELMCLGSQADGRGGTVVRLLGQTRGYHEDLIMVRLDGFGAAFPYGRSQLRKVHP
jgi:hypothetical protein